MLETIIANKADIQFAILLALALACWRWGAGPEKACAIVLLLMKLLDLPYHWISGRGVNFLTVDVGHAAIDVSASVALVLIALRANRLYPLCMAGFQLISLISHLTRAAMEQTAPLAYSILMIAPSYLLIGTLALGLFLHRRRLMRYGPYRSWRSGSVPLRGTGQNL